MSMGVIGFLRRSWKTVVGGVAAVAAMLLIWGHYREKPVYPPHVHAIWVEEFQTPFERTFPGIDPNGFEATNWTQVGIRFLAPDEMGELYHLWAIGTLGFDSAERCVLWFNGQSGRDENYAWYGGFKESEVRRLFQLNWLGVQRLTAHAKEGGQLQNPREKETLGLEDLILKYVEYMKDPGEKALLTRFFRRSAKEGENLTSQEACRANQVFFASFSKGEAPAELRGEIVRIISSQTPLLSKIPAGVEPQPAVGASSAVSTGAKR